MNDSDKNFIAYLKTELIKPERGIKPKSQELIFKLIDIIEKEESQLALSIEREERYRKALEEIELQTSYVGGKEMPIVIIKAHNIARTALNEGKEVK